MKAKNNIFNIRAGANWHGMEGVCGGFVEFEDREYGVRAWLKLMRTYRRTKTKEHPDGVRTIRDIVMRFAPPSDRNPTANYIRFCCGKVKVSADEVLTKVEQYALLGVAMAWFETRTRLRAEDVLEVMKKYNIIIIEDGKRED